MPIVSSMHHTLTRAALVDTPAADCVSTGGISVNGVRYQRDYQEFSRVWLSGPIMEIIKTIRAGRERRSHHRQERRLPYRFPTIILLSLH